MKKVADKLEENFKKTAKNSKEDGTTSGFLSNTEWFRKKNSTTGDLNSACLKTLTESISPLMNTKKTRKKTVKPIRTKKLVYLYTSDADAQFSFIESAKERGYDVLLMDGILDNHFINQLEQKKFGDVSFKRVDADTVEKIDREERPRTVQTRRQAKKEKNWNL